MIDSPIGVLTYDEAWGEYRSGPHPVHSLGGRAFTFGFESPDDARCLSFARRFIESDEPLLERAEPYVRQYRREMLVLWMEAGLAESVLDGVDPGEPDDVWSEVDFFPNLSVVLRLEGDRSDGVYVAFECDCAWEPEHGLAIVFREDFSVATVGPCDGHLLNTPPGVVYRSFA